MKKVIILATSGFYPSFILILLFFYVITSLSPDFTVLNFSICANNSPSFFSSLPVLRPLILGVPTFLYSLQCVIDFNLFLLKLIDFEAGDMQGFCVEAPQKHNTFSVRDIIFMSENEDVSIVDKASVNVLEDDQIKGRLTNCVKFCQFCICFFSDFHHENLMAISKAYALNIRSLFILNQGKFKRIITRGKPCPVRAGTDSFAQKLLLFEIHQQRLSICYSLHIQLTIRYRMEGI